MYALSLIATVLDHFALEIRNLQRTEIDEVRESFVETQIGSSTMPQKKDPEKSERICGLARVVRGYLQTSLDNICLEHERDLTNSSSERIIFSEASILTHFLLEEMNIVLQTLYINKSKIQENLYFLKGAQCAEHLMIKLSSKIGRQKAHDLLKKLSSEENFSQAVKNNDIVKQHYNNEEIDKILDPMNYTGLSNKIVEDFVTSIK